MQNLVSILIPAYNSARWLSDSVSSALAQTWPRKEIIIVDDGSNDDTLALAKTFEGPIVKVVAQQNTGAPDARNKALSYAQGDYIQWLDADDVLHPQKIEAQLKGADDGQRSLTLLTSSWGRFFFRVSAASFRPDALWHDLAPVDWLVTRFKENVWMNPAVWLVSRRLTDLAGPWDSRCSGDDDGEYICRVVAASDRVKFVEEARCFYRIGTVGSLSWKRQTDDRMLESLLLSLHLRTRTLIAMEDTERTRRVARSHLQALSSYFYASDGVYFERLNAMALELGGPLDPPSLSWKYYPIQVALGPRFALSFMRNWHATKLTARRSLDWYLHRAGL